MPSEAVPHCTKKTEAELYIARISRFGYGKRPFGGAGSATIIPGARLHDIAPEPERNYLSIRAPRLSPSERDRFIARWRDLGDRNRDGELSHADDVEAMQWLEQLLLDQCVADGGTAKDSLLHDVGEILKESTLAGAFASEPESKPEPAPSSSSGSWLIPAAIAAALALLILPG